jgi:signal transduction histidine kinase
MSIEARFHDLADHARDLLSCTGVNLCLLCPDELLRHPLLNIFPVVDAAPFLCYGSAPGQALLHSEAVSALYDMAMQTNLVWDMDFCEMDWQGEEIVGSVAVAPLERPAGILGLLLCMNTQLETFSYGECLLIEQYRMVVARQVEQILEEMGKSARQDDIVTDVQEQSEFISLVSHELRVPLTAIKGYAGLLQAYAVADLHDEKIVAGREVNGEIACANDGMEMTQARQQKYLDAIVEQADYLEVLMNDLLDVSRIQSGRLALQRSWIDIATLCQRVAQLEQDRIEEQRPGHYQICCNIEANLPRVWADPNRVRQVLINLVENAIKYSPSGGLIEILAYTCGVQKNAQPQCISCTHLGASSGRSTRCGTQLVAANIAESQAMYISVCDQGVGIPYQQQLSLFRLYTRLEHPATRQVVGSGLGLYLSRKLVEAMGGQMLLQSREGQGTCISFTLPILP